MSKSLQFYATGSDLKPFLAAVELQRPLWYAVGGTSVKQEPEVFDSSQQLPNLGIAMMGDQNREPFYLVTDENIAVEARAVPQRRGGMRFSFDQQANPRSIILRPGGAFQGKFLIAGQLGTCSPDEESVNLIKLFAKVLRQRFSKVRSYFVGEEALRLLEDGMRLTTSVLAPVEYDLKKTEKGDRQEWH